MGWTIFVCFLFVLLGSTWIVTLLTAPTGGPILTFQLIEWWWRILVGCFIIMLVKK